jgi:hypothetical protein
MGLVGPGGEGLEARQVHLCPATAPLKRRRVSNNRTVRAGGSPSAGTKRSTRYLSAGADG